MPRAGGEVWSDLAMVGLGGAVGTGLREALTIALQRDDGARLATLSANVVGAFVLGALVPLLAHGPHAHRLRLLLGTGMLGGFTTYSALATQTALLAGDRLVSAAIGYAVTTVVLGVVAALLGVLLGARLSSRRSGPV